MSPIRLSWMGLSSTVRAKSNTMDKNKVLKLQQISYEIKPVCGLCQHFSGHDSQGFGSCGNTTYEHLKHTGPERPLSVHAFGSCHEFKKNPIGLGKLHGFAEFLKDPGRGACRWTKAWVGPCEEEALEDGFCFKHSGKTCVSCAGIANHDCPQTMGPFVCGCSLCDNCDHGDPRWFDHSLKHEALEARQKFWVETGLTGVPTGDEN